METECDPHHLIGLRGRAPGEGAREVFTGGRLCTVGSKELKYHGIEQLLVFCVPQPL